MAGQTTGTWQTGCACIRRLRGLSWRRHWLLLVGALVVVAACTSPVETNLPIDRGSVAEPSPGHEPIRAIPLSVDLDAAKVALGSSLFRDPRLSHDNSVACSTCHHLDLAGVDRLPRSIGIYGQVGGRNAPTVFNSGFNFRQFWDGRAATLEDQIDGPIAGPLEMGSNWSEIIQKVNDSPDYAATFTRLYGERATTLSLKNAVATFERSLNTPNSRFDRFLAGEATALNSAEVEGYADFKSFGCVSCHQGTNVGGNMYQRLGVLERLSPSSALIADPGRFGVTGDQTDTSVFKVPSLRNVAVTPPYFHDGSVTTLEGAIAIMGRYQLGRQLSVVEVQRLAAFLKTLTGEYGGSVLQ